MSGGLKNEDEVKATSAIFLFLLATKSAAGLF
jgi:hypothetical protein